MGTAGGGGGDGKLIENFAFKVFFCPSPTRVALAKIGGWGKGGSCRMNMNAHVRANSGRVRIEGGEKGRGEMEKVSRIGFHEGGGDVTAEA